MPEKKKLKLAKVGKPENIKKNFSKVVPDHVVRLTYVLIGVCLLVAVLQTGLYFLEGEEAVDVLFQEYGFSINGFLAGDWWTPITSMFLHGSVDHLIFNMIVLYFFGKATEEKLGWKKTLLVFLIAGLAGNLATLLGGFAGLIPMGIPTIGASAAIFGLMGVSMIVDPLEMVFYPFLIPIPLIFVAVIYGLYNIIASLELFFGGASQIAYLAHIGGLTAGGIFGFHQVGWKRALAVIIAIVLLVISLPLILQYLHVFDYSGMFG